MGTRTRRGARAIALVAATLAATLAAGCGDVFHPAAPAPSAVGVSFSATSPLGGPGEAYESADRIRIEIRDASSESLIVEHEGAFEAGGEETRIPLSVRLEDGPLQVFIEVELTDGGAPLFRGFDEAELRPGEASEVTIGLEPIPAGVEIAEPIETITAFGASVGLEAAVTFATADTIPDAFVSWRSLDPSVAEIERQGEPRAVGVADGEARIVASAGTVADTAIVTVRAAIASVAVDPASAEIAVGRSQAFAATPRDENGNPVPGRDITWSVGDPAVASVDAGGVVLGLSPGTTTVTATSEGVPGSAGISVIRIVPSVATLPADGIGTGDAVLHGEVNPNGSETQAWFEWAGDPAVLDTDPTTTQAEAVGSGVDPVPVSAALAGLLSGTRYYYRAVAANAAGPGAGAVDSFTTRQTVPSAPSDLTATWDSVTDVITLRWRDNSHNEAEFRIYREDVSRERPRRLLDTVGEDVESYVDNSVTFGEFYVYWVRACNSAGCSADSNQAQESAYAPPAPSGPSTGPPGEPDRRSPADDRPQEEEP